MEGMGDRQAPRRTAQTLGLPFQGGDRRFGAGGSNFGFVDGSVRTVPYGRATAPVNLWAVTPEERRIPLGAP